MQKLEADIVGYLIENGISGSQGTNKSEKIKDIIETISFGIYDPKKLIKKS